MTKSTLKKIFGLLFLGFCLSSSIQAQQIQTFDYTFKIKGLKAGDTCMIANYLGTKQYIKDTLVVPKSGIVNYKGKDLDGGIYLFVVPGMKYFEFLAAEPKISMETDLNDLVPAMKVKVSNENKVFFDYLKFVEDKQKEGEKIKADLGKEKAEPKIAELKARMGEIESEVKAYRENVIKNNSDKFVSKLLHASQEPELSEVPAGTSPEDAKLLQFKEYKGKYLDFVDFSDERMLRTPILQNKIKDYLTRLTVQHPDSIILSIEDIMNRAQSNTEVFKYCVITITNMYAGSKQMCFDKIYVHMAGTYYVSGQATWVDSTQMSKIKDRYYKMMYNTCQRTAVNLVLKDTEDKPIALSDVKGKYTVLIFWAYDCGHCKKEMPQLVEFYKKYKEHGVKMFTVTTKNDKEKWKTFLKEKGMEDWINGYDPENKTNFRVFYDIYSTPVIYLLDEDKKILAKRLDIHNLERLLSHELGLPMPEEPEKPKDDAGKGDSH